MYCRPSGRWKNGKKYMKNNENHVSGKELTIGKRDKKHIPYIRL